MLKLANQILDAYDDVGFRGLKKIASKNPSAYLMTPDQRNQLQDTDFALSVITKKAAKLNKFPVNTKDNAWLSSEFFELNHHKLPKTAAEIAAFNIKKACERFGVQSSPAVEGLAKEASSNIFFEAEGLKPVRRSVQPDLEKIADVQAISDNYTAAQYAFSTPNHVKVACQYFADHAEQLPTDMRHKYAAAIQRRAAELGMGAQKGAVEKYASDHYSPMVDAHLRSRSSLLEVAEPGMRGALEKIAGLKSQLAPAQFAKLLHGFDKRAKLDRYYGSYLTDPYLATFAGAPDPYHGYSYKFASKELSAEDIKAIIGSNSGRIRDYFGPHFEAEMKKDPVAIFDSLPNDAKELIAGMADGTV